MRNFYLFMILMSNLPAARNGRLAGSMEFRVHCAEQPTIVRNWVPALLYTVQDQRVLVTAKFGTAVNIRCADSVLWPIRCRVRQNRVAMSDRPSSPYQQKFAYNLNEVNQLK